MQDQPDQYVRGSIEPGPENRLIINMEYQLPFVGTPGKDKHIVHEKIENLTVSRITTAAPLVDRRLEEFRFTPPNMLAAESPERLSIDADEMINKLNNGTAKAYLTNVRIVIPTLSSGLKQTPMSVIPGSSGQREDISHLILRMQKAKSNCCTSPTRRCTQ